MVSIQIFTGEIAQLVQYFFILWVIWTLVRLTILPLKFFVLAIYGLVR